jgi:hypothetical protein
VSIASSTTSPASRRRRSSGSSAALLGLLLLGAAPPEPVVRITEDGVVDWSTRTVRAIGVGTPKILSPTGGITPRDPYVVAREDAKGRLERLLARVRVEPGTRLAGYEAVAERRASAIEQFTTQEALRFSDGTVHLPVTVPFDWVPSALVGRDPVKASEDAVVTGLVIRVEGKIEPRLRLKLGAGKRSVGAGFPDDPVGSGGVAWFHDEKQALAWPTVGPRPRVVSAKSDAKGTLQLTGEDASVLDGLPGGVALVVK